jgi:hypothetical protein
MKFDVRQNKMLAHGALIIGIAIAGILTAEGFNMFGPTSQAAMTPSILPSTQTQPSESAEKIADWFTKYDAIRRQAQMTPQEKMTSTKLMTQSFTGVSTDEKAEGRILLSKMLTRYMIACDQLRGLSPPPQTAELQKGYQEYFTAGRAFFTKYLIAMDNNQEGNAIDTLRADRSRMATIDMSNKALDKRLRARYGISPYQYY